MNAVDGDPETGWEIAGEPFPYELRLDFPTTHTLRGYILSTWVEPDRMPNGWEIWVSPDGANSAPPAADGGRNAVENQ